MEKRERKRMTKEICIYFVKKDQVSSVKRVYQCHIFYDQVPDYRYFMQQVPHDISKRVGRCTDKMIKNILLSQLYVLRLSSYSFFSHVVQVHTSTCNTTHLRHLSTIFSL